jgi:site-specific DNA-methyltransferase (adenine-specific)/site-specific DNA-methyltransferase (cytosine-N4-specific)
MPEIKLITGDATNLSFIKSNSIDLIIAAPPFINRDPNGYGGDPRKQVHFDSNKMLKLLIKSTKEMERVLKPTGSIWIEISPEEDLMHKYISEVLKKTKLIHPDTIIHKVSDDEDKSKLDEDIYKDWYLWFHFVKDSNQYYKNPFKVKKYKDPVWNLPLSNKNDIIDKTLSFTYPKINHYAVIKDIPERFIEMYTKEGAVVLDPFGGSGTVASVAYQLNRNSISVDVSPEQTAIANKRIDLLKSINNV